SITAKNRKTWFMQNNQEDLISLKAHICLKNTFSGDPKYKSGQEGDWFLVGFSPRKQNLTLYIMSGFDKYDEYLQKLGKHKLGKSCLYLKKLADVDMSILEEMISKSIDEMPKIC
ncbi:MAG: DUF1801 domain-containing protein, partial [Candidatus Electryonea clarkiae]|nr:DUF1801 domain-containing protein [Candidatus Electryonea clarkiae]